MPNAINVSLSKSLYGISTEGKLTKRQLRQVTGFFKPMDTAQAVKNLVQFELWNPGTMDKLPRRAERISSFGKKASLPRWYYPDIETFWKPDLKGENDIYRDYQPLIPSARKEAARIVRSVTESVDETPLFEVRVNRIICGV